MTDYPIKDQGYLEETRPAEFLTGIIPYRVVLQTGDWRPFVPAGEPQFSQVSDSMSCVSYSNNNLCEISLKQQGYDLSPTGFSDRALAKLSGTTKKGNTFAAVADSTYRNGRILEAEWPVPQNFTWDSFYADIPQNIKDKAVFFDEDYQFISPQIDNLKYHLKQCPIQISIPYPVPNHAVVLLAIIGSTAYYFDSYPGATNYLKTMPVSDINSAMKLIIKPKIMTKYYIIKSGQKLGVAVEEGYVMNTFFAADLPDFERLKDALNAPANMQTVILPQ